VTGISGKLQDLDCDLFSPGDLAVAADGRHVLVYLREGKWIQANPVELKVTIGHAKRDQIAWSDSFMTMHRWMVLE
jgi:hypothetical protein